LVGRGADPDWLSRKYREKTDPKGIAESTLRV
jgi:hypothetical protein